ncbi:relaxase/mobilization nuclease domain-containing protein [Filimonas effusa]|uniref:Relaxase n=1 Tax=Filimonas effusa TaxID=2508721 RepID=A0A4Q1D9Z7_9BACT|nr:relaxase/mobilization nuclease domain-containing protein [Filimonas effusa]RXK86191.1 relaxase [Filimonas effusa]
MRPQISYPKSLSRVLNYNENKVKDGKALLLAAVNFLKNPDELKYREKYDTFKDRMDLNTRADTKLLHVSLNLHPSETHKLTPEFSKVLATEFMEKMGFGDQPYLVYQHFDAAHLHLNIVTTLIKEDGERINTHYQAKEKSEPIRKELEEKYGLIKVDKLDKAAEKRQALALDTRSVQYGRSETLRGITNVLDHVLLTYRYTSLEQLNTVLKGFNVIADRGKEGSSMYENRGLYYRALDENGQKIGVPIKASDIYSKPTLDELERHFKDNQQQAEKGKQSLKTKIDWQISQQPLSLRAFQQGLEKENVSLVIWQNEQGRVYGLTFVDHDKKTVYNGSDLDKNKEYGAKRIMERMGLSLFPEEGKKAEKLFQKDLNNSAAHERSPANSTAKQSQPDRNERSKLPELSNDTSPLTELMQPKGGGQSLNHALKDDEEERRRNRHQHTNDNSLER